MAATSSKGGRPLTSLLLTSKAACDHIRELVSMLYASMSVPEQKQRESKLKADDSFFSIADGLVQELLQRHLFAGRVAAIVGEEETAVNITSRPFSVESLEVPARFFDDIERVRDAIAGLGQTIDDSAYRELTVFIDPIDGTREFCTGKGEQCSILIGFAREGRSVAGLVYRPLSAPVTWAAGCAEEDCKIGELDNSATNQSGFLTTNGRITKFTESLMDELGYERVRSGGCGNKLLMLVEGKGACYIQDRGVCRWDTCAPEAVIEAYGGALLKLSNFVADGTHERYTYRQTDSNLDFVPGMSLLSLYNARDKQRVKKDEKVVVQDAAEILPFSNVCGLLALPALGVVALKHLTAAVDAAKQKSPPEFT